MKRFTGQNVGSRKHISVPAKLLSTFITKGLLFKPTSPPPDGTTSPAGQGLVIIEAPRSRTTHLVGLLWKSKLYGTTHNTHKRQTFLPPVEFEPTIPANERPQTHALERAATGTGM